MQSNHSMQSSLLFLCFVHVLFQESFSTRWHEKAPEKIRKAHKKAREEEEKKQALFRLKGIDQELWILTARQWKEDGIRWAEAGKDRSKRAVRFATDLAEAAKSTGVKLSSAARVGKKKGREPEVIDLREKAAAAWTHASAAWSDAAMLIQKADELTRDGERKLSIVNNELDARYGGVGTRRQEAEEILEEAAELRLSAAKAGLKAAMETARGGADSLLEELVERWGDAAQGWAQAVKETVPAKGDKASDSAASAIQAIQEATSRKALPELADRATLPNYPTEVAERLLLKGKLSQGTVPPKILKERSLPLLPEPPVETRRKGISKNARRKRRIEKEKEKEKENAQEDEDEDEDEETEDSTAEGSDKEGMKRKKTKEQIRHETQRSLMKKSNRAKPMVASAQLCTQTYQEIIGIFALALLGLVAGCRVAHMVLHCRHCKSTMGNLPTLSGH